MSSENPDSTPQPFIGEFDPRTVISAIQLGHRIGSSPGLFTAYGLFRDIKIKELAASLDNGQILLTGQDDPEYLSHLKNQADKHKTETSNLQEKLRQYTETWPELNDDYSTIESGFEEATQYAKPANVETPDPLMGIIYRIHLLQLIDHFLKVELNH